MALVTPLNHRQFEVLRWINDGCPEGRWTDFTYKTTASALQSRRLVGISKRGGKWSATILPAGVAYLANGQYPSGHWTKKRGAVAVDLDFGATTSLEQAASAWKPRPPRPPKPPSPDGLTPTRKLLKDSIDADGILERDTRDDDTKYRSLVGIINRRQMAPDGQEVIMLTGRSYHHVLFRLSSVSDWKTTSPGETVAAERITRWHPTVASLRTDKRLSTIDKSFLNRAFRLLHALAASSRRRGPRPRCPSTAPQLPRAYRGLKQAGRRPHLQSREHRVFCQYQATAGPGAAHADETGVGASQAVFVVAASDV